jgi:hypothetical protein
MDSKLILIAVAALALGGCNRHEPGTQPQYTHLFGDVLERVTPPASPDRGPVAPDANTAAPGTDASIAFAAQPEAGSEKLPPGKGGGPPGQHAEVAAQDAAAKAPDTAAADAEKQRVLSAYEKGEASETTTVAAAPMVTPSPQEEAPPQQ